MELDHSKRGGRHLACDKGTVSWWSWGLAAVPSSVFCRRVEGLPMVSLAGSRSSSSLIKEKKEPQPLLSHTQAGLAEHPGAPAAPIFSPAQGLVPLRPGPSVGLPQPSVAQLSIPHIPLAT